MGLPQIIIDFKSKGASAIKRSSGGTVLLILRDDTKSGQMCTYDSIDEVVPSKHTDEILKYIMQCFTAMPKKIICVNVHIKENAIDYPVTNALIENLRFNWIGVCAADYDMVQLKSLIVKMRESGQAVKAVTAGKGADHEAIVQIGGDSFSYRYAEGVVEYDAMTALVPRIVGILTALPMGDSITYYPVPELVSYTYEGSLDEAVEHGELVFVKGDSGFKVARGVTSLTSATADKPAAMKKIKIIDAIDTIRTDIKNSLENNYIGKVVNDYSSKLLLANAIKGYFEQLGSTVLDASYDNEVGISYEAQLNFLRAQGVDTDALSETQVLKANTGSQVFLTATVRFVDAMEDISFILTM